jgi:CheY-like chemotaxis protein
MGLERLRQGHGESDPHRIAIIDGKMPGMDGEELGRRIKDDSALKDTALVMLTSVGERGEAARLNEIGFAAYLTKPVKPSQLYDCLATVLGRHGQQTPPQPAALITRHSLAEERRRQGRILIVEDNAVNQRVAQRLLERLGYRAEVVGNGLEAVKALELAPYDVVLMDVQMPEMDGFEATRVIRDPQSAVRDHEVPIIAMTAHAMKGDREKCIEAGMDDYVAKPVGSAALAEAIERRLAG